MSFPLSPFSFAASKPTSETEESEGIIVEIDRLDRMALFNEGGTSMLQGLGLLVVIGQFAFAIAAFVLIILLIRRLLADERDRKERIDREQKEDK